MVYSASQVEDPALHGKEKTWLQALEAAGHIASAAREQKELNSMLTSISLSHGPQCMQ